ncbi:MAG: hypothetical protein ACI84R_003064 [Candidatus Azotimanducaceae bacterium]|jgi:hypothetical protein
MKHITQLKPKETIDVDQDRLSALYTQLGEANAEDVVCRAMEELALRLSFCDRQHRAAALVDLRKSVRSLIAIADQIGMSAVSAVAVHVTNCIDQNDLIALAATMGRLMRIGEESLTAIWDLQDITI